ncbi:MAG TPA: CHAT domain-containing tetratricopeptide repeat protein, partial [Pirellulales bacterium]|nr:CHAT domain-containing tetratricopeptide repeat protein [Pirellulales bacterium]
VLHNLMYLESTQGKLEEAEAYGTRSLKIRESLLGKDHPDVGRSLQNLAWLRLRQKDPAAAAPLFQRALNILSAHLGPDHPDLVNSLAGQAWIHLAAQEWEPAVADFDRIRRLARHYITQVLPALNEREQLTFLETRDRISFHTCLGLSQLKPDDTKLAAQTAAWLLNGKGVAQESLVQQAALSRDSADPHFASVAKQLTQVRTQLANLNHVAPQPGQAAARPAQLARLAAQEQDLSRQLSRLGGLVAPAPWIELSKVRAALAKGAVFVDLLRYEPRPFTLEAIDRKNYPAHYAAWITPPAGRGEVAYVDLGEADPIDRAIQQFQAAFQECQNPDRSKNPLTALGEPDAEKKLFPSLREVERRILEPLRPHLQDAEEIILSPDANLWLIPWNALPIEANQYAIEKWNLHFVISGRDLVTERPQRTANPPRIFADPNYDLPAAEIMPALASVFGRPLRASPAEGSAGQPAANAAAALLGNLDHTQNNRSALLIGHVPLLAGTAAEARAITPNLEKYAGAPKQYSENQALEGVFKRLASPRVLVLSTHGFFLPDQTMRGSSAATADSSTSAALLNQEGHPYENPLLRCGLLLAGCNNRDKITDPALDDGVLTGMEIVGTDLRGTELVVLSACETGLGQVQNGEGVAGLRQAFHLAGAPAVVSTLWQIPDQATALLMNDFFGNLAAGQSKSDALRHAQLTRIQARRDKYGAAHPLYWAAFTLTGE